MNLGRTICLLLTLLGSGCFILNYFWLTPKIGFLFAQYHRLIDMGLPEEAVGYKSEALQLSHWVVPLTVLGFALIAPLVMSLIASVAKKSVRHT